jgi:hypothetical protein
MTQISEDRAMIGFPATALTAIHAALAADRPAAEAAEAARQLGFATGTGFYRAFEEWIGAAETRDAGDLDPGGFWDLFGRFFAEHGWGHLEVEHLHPAVASLASRDWAEASRPGGTRHPSCHLTTGMLAEMLGRVGGEDLAVLEVECRAKGDPHCRFLLGGQQTLERVFGALRSGHGFAEAIQELDD